MNPSIKYIITTQQDVEAFIDIRLEMLKEVNKLSENYQFSGELVSNSRRYFEEGDQTTILAMDDDKVIGCATLSYIEILPTYSHPTGKRAHLMNVYTQESYRRQGIAYKMIQMLIDEAKEKGVTEISLDATQSGMPLYEKLGFEYTQEGMTLVFEENT